MKIKRRILSLITALVFLLPLGACSKTEDAYIYFELPELPATLDAQTASTDSELLIVKNIYEGLLRRNSKGEISFGLAEKYTLNGLTYTFNLRKDAKWSNGDKITADDFVFAMRRAVNPETKAPFASRLFCITGAEEIYNSKASADSLGVKAVNQHTLTITLKKLDDYFLETLTTSVAMPCNRKFFESSAGKYGLFADHILSNGSYKITRWRKDPFGIRLYKNKDYSGETKAKNAAVFITCDSDEAPLEKLEKNSIDIAFIDSALTDTAENSGLKTAKFENICWVMTLSDDFSKDMRKSLAMLVGGEVYGNDLPTGYSIASSLFPAALNEKSILTGLVSYNPSAAKQLYLKELEKLENKRFPSNVLLYYYDDGSVKDVVTDIVGHWQSNLSAFVNIEAVLDSDLLTSQLINQSYGMAFFPIKADNPNISEYLVKYGYSYNSQDLSKAQTDILRDTNIIPVMFQNTVIAYSPALTEMTTQFGNGYIDFAFIVKTE